MSHRQKVRAALALGTILGAGLATPAIAQTTTPATTSQGTTPPSESEATALAQAAPDNAATAPTGADIVVTGSYLSNVRQEDRASPVVAVNQQQIAKTGITALGDLTKYIPQNIGSTGGIQDLAKGGADSRDTRSANLRGLGSGATLVLLNGRRVVPLDGYVNLNSLTPDIAIARVDTVLDGASSTYGADAVAGVVNIITDTHFRGLKLSGQITQMADSPAWNVQGMWGIGSGAFHSVTAVSYRYVDRLQNGDRKITDFFNGSSGPGANPGSYVLYGRPTTADGGDVVIGGHDYSTLYDQYKNADGQLTVVDPQCGSAATQSIFTPSASGPGYGIGSCTFSYQAQNPIRPQSKSINVHNDTTFEFAPNQTLYAEISIYHQDAKRYGVPSFAQNHNGPMPPIMPADNPYNPFGVDIGFIGRPIGSAGFPGAYYKVEHDGEDQRHFVLGARGDISRSWHYAASVTSSHGRVTTNDKDTDMRLFQAALDGYGGPNCNYRFNGAGSGATPGTGSCLWYSPLAKDTASLDPSLIYNIQTNEFAVTDLDYKVAEGVVNGTLAEINGRPIDVAIGGQYRREHQTNHYSDLLTNGFGAFNGPFIDSDLSRTVKSVFGEANYELIKHLNIDIAARYEDYGNFNTLAPKISANWRILPWLSLRGSASKAFQAPSIQNSTRALLGTGVGNVTDPLSGITVFRSIQTYGNPNLKPQKADVFNIGTTILPVDGMRVSFDYWNYKYKSQIQTQNAQAVINADPNGPNVIRDSSGVAQTVIIQSFNAPSGTATSGIDGAFSYNFDIGDAQVSLHENATYLIRYDIDTGTTVYNGVGHRNNYQTSPSSAAAAPRWRSLAGVDVSLGRHSLSGTWRYASGVIDDYFQVLGAKPIARIRPWSVFDVQYGYEFGADRQLRADFGMTNIFNTAPGFAKFTGYLPSVADPFGRQVYIRIGAKF
jgi:iron complex outermembrane receptor protein